MSPVRESIPLTGGTWVYSRVALFIGHESVFILCQSLIIIYYLVSNIIKYYILDLSSYPLYLIYSMR